MCAAGVINRVAIVLTISVLAACEAAAPQPSAGRGDVSMPPAPTASQGSAAIDPTPTGPPTAAPTPEPLVLGGTWVRPAQSARLTAYTTKLSARPSGTGDGDTTFTDVAFSVAWAGGHKKVACKATVPDDDRVWTCEADLLALGVPPGAVTFSFDVHGVGVPAARSPDGRRHVTYAVAPPRPTKTRLVQLERPDLDGGDNSAILHQVRWAAPAGYADEFLVYETTECPRKATRKTNGTPCFVAGTPVDTSLLELRGKTSGSARSVKIRLAEAECGPSHGTILLRARNSYGKSVFAIVDAAPIIWLAPNEMIC
jgi:hypothetical protein